MHTSGAQKLKATPQNTTQMSPSHSVLSVGRPLGSRLTHSVGRNRHRMVYTTSSSRLNVVYFLSAKKRPLVFIISLARQTTSENSLLDRLKEPNANPTSCRRKIINGGDSQEYSTMIVGVGSENVTVVYSRVAFNRAVPEVSHARWPAPFQETNKTKKSLSFNGIFGMPGAHNPHTSGQGN